MTVHLELNLIVVIVLKGNDFTENWFNAEK